MSTQRKTNWLKGTEEGKNIKQKLKSMQTNDGYITDSCYSTNGEEYENNLMTFAEKHMHYLNTHPNVNPDQYLSNLRIMTKIRI
ncbi:hypothetical protein KBB17_03855 [Candidatus Saccharibacteria bacterium]|nr:hypothetical protein [Candidatus Saccharibacteria bacterium]MBP9132080.1 hypothetical protein [Candidatus Saccharibacteria bacterium]